VEEAHYLAEEVCIGRFQRDPMWREFIVELHISDVENIAGEIKEKSLK